jgi:hypothetical protein
MPLFSTAQHRTISPVGFFAWIIWCLNILASTNQYVCIRVAYLKDHISLQVFQGTGGSWDVEPGSSMGSPRDETVNWALPAGQYNPAMQRGYGR